MLKDIKVTDVPENKKDIKIQELEQELRNVKQELEQYRDMYLDAVTTIKLLEARHDTRHNSKNGKS